MTTKEILELDCEHTSWDIYNVSTYKDSKNKEHYDSFYVDIMTRISPVVGDVCIATVMVQCNDKDDELYNDQYIVDVVTRNPHNSEEIIGQYNGRYDMDMVAVDNLELDEIRDVTSNGDTLDQFIIRMLRFIFNAQENKNMRNPERYEVKIGHDKQEPVQIRHRGCFAWEGCHKIYICQTIEDVYQQITLGYDIYPIELLKSVWKESCSLRFIHPANLKGDILPQGATYPKILGHVVKAKKN